MPRAAKTAKAATPPKTARDLMQAQTVAVSTAASGVTQMVAAVAGKRIRLFGYSLVSGGGVNWKWQSAANDLTGACPMIAGQQQSMGPAYDGVLECNVGEALNLNLSGAIQVSGFVIYGVIGG